MFRTLATRLVALWVFAILALFVLAVGAVTAISLSAFRISEMQALDTTANRAPTVAVAMVEQHGGFDLDTEKDIVHDLMQPGLRVGFTRDGDDIPTVVGWYEGDQPVVQLGPALPGTPGGPSGGPGAPGQRFHQGETALPFALNSFLHMEPRHVDVAGGHVFVVVDPRPLARTIDGFWTAMVPIGLLLIAAAIVFGRYLTSLALRPLTETTAALQRFAAGDFTPRPVAASGRDEIAELVLAYNGAVQQVAAAFDERRAAEMQMRQFIGDAGHELRTPLTVIMGFIDVLRRRGTGDATTTKIHDTMLVESRRMRALVDKLILLARLENVQFAPDPSLVDVGELAARAVSTFAPLQANPRITLHAEPDALAHVQESELYEAIQNLIENALKYAPLSNVDVRVARDGESIEVSVEDGGPGLTEDDRLHVFDRFYRGSQKVDKEGFGLGLAIVKRAVERAGGSVAVESEPGRGACFTLRLPRATEERSTAGVAVG